MIIGLESKKHLKNPVILIICFIDELVKLLNQKNKRQVLEDLAKIRYPIYQEADFDFDTTHLTHEDLIEKIINKIKDYKNV